MPARVFYIHAPADDAFLGALEVHLAVLARQGRIEGWHAGLLTPGAEIGRQIEEHIQSAQVVLLLVSPDLFASDRDYALLLRALRRHDDQAIHLVPVIVRPVEWQTTPLGGLSVLPPGGKPISTWQNLDEAWLEVVRGVSRLVDSPVATRPSTAGNPYRGLSVFQEEHSHLFHGREELSRQLWQLVYGRHQQDGALRLVSVLGPSGSGKSSLALAGLLPLLRAHPLGRCSGIQAVVMTPGERPIERLARALMSLSPADPLRAAQAQTLEEELLRRRSEAGAYEGLRRFASNLLGVDQKPLLLIVDQFEEIYTQHTPPGDRALLVDLLLHAAADKERCVSVILTLRSDFFEETRQHPRLNRAIADKQAHVLVPVMSREELRRAIALPAAQHGRPLDDATVDRLLTEAEDRPGVLPLLEFALTRIWEGLGQGQEPARTLHAIGGVGGALAGEAQRIYEELAAYQQNITRRVFLGMVQLGEGDRDTRRRVRVTDLVAQGEKLLQSQEVLRRFAMPGVRLVTLSADEERQEWAEVTHESLFDHWRLLRKWINQGREDLRFHRRLTDATKHWEANGRLAVHLWRPPDLDLLNAFLRRASRDMTEQEVEFADSSARLEAARVQQIQEAQRRERRRARLLAVATLAVAIIVSALGLVSWKQRGAAIKARNEAEAERRNARLRLTHIYAEYGRQEVLQGRWQRAVVYLLEAYQDLDWRALSDRYLLGVATSQTIDVMKILAGHEGKVWYAGLSPDGTRIITASDDNTARLWDGRTGREIATLRGHEKAVRSAEFSASDGERIVTAGSDSVARLWDGKTGKLLANLVSHQGSVLSARFSTDGAQIVTAGSDGTAQLWDGKTGKHRAILRGHQGPVLSARFSADGARIVTASDDGTVRLWDGKTCTLSATLRPGPEERGDRSLRRVWSAEFSPDGVRIVTASDDGVAQVWEVKTGKVVFHLSGHKGRVRFATFDPAGANIITVSDDNTARLWDGETGKALATLDSPAGAVRSVGFNGDGTRIVTAGDDSVVRLWDRKGKALAVLEGHTGRVNSAIFSRDGARIVTASDDYTARLWDGKLGKPLFPLLGHRGEITVASFSPRDGARIVTASDDSTARLWDGKTGNSKSTLEGHKDVVRVATFSPPDGARLVTASNDSTARLWDGYTGQFLASLEGHRGWVSSATFSPDGALVVTTSEDSEARLWDGQRGKLLNILKGHTGWVKAAKFSPDGTRLVTAGDDGTARLWEVKTCQLLTTLRGHQGALRSAWFSPIKGTRIVTASDDTTARLWELKTGTCQVLVGHADRVNSAKFNPGGTLIVTGSDDGTARLWDGETGKALAALEGHTDKVRIADFSADGVFIVTASDDSTARLWDGKTGKALATFGDHSGPVTFAEFSPDGTRLVTASADSTARLWGLQSETRPLDELVRLVRCYAPFALIDEQLLPAKADAGPCMHMRKN